MIADNHLSIPQLLKLFPTDAAAEAWFVSQRWPDGIACPHCGDMDIQEGAAHPSMPYRCRGCKKFFSVKTGTVLQGSKLGYQTWLLAIHAMSSNPKGASSIQLHKDLGITQKTAWFLAHRIREGWGNAQPVFTGEVEVDETFIGGLERNKHGVKRRKKGTGFIGKTIVVGLRERRSGRIHAEIITNTTRTILSPLVDRCTDKDAVVYTDEHSGYDKVKRHRFAIRHGIREYVQGRVHTNGIESFWALFKRGRKGTYHKMSPKHLMRYITEFVGRNNCRPSSVLQQMGDIVKGLDGKRLTYAQLVSSNGLESGARAKSPAHLAWA